MILLSPQGSLRGCALMLMNDKVAQNDYGQYQEVIYGTSK